MNIDDFGVEVDEPIDEVEFGVAPVDLSDDLFRPNLNSRRHSRVKQILSIGVVAIAVALLSVWYKNQSQAKVDRSQLDNAADSSAGLDALPSPNNPVQKETRITELSDKYATAKGYWKAGAYQMVIDECTKIVDGSPEDTQAIYARGAAYGKIFNWRAAVKDHDTVLNIDLALAKQPSDGYAAAYHNVAIELEKKAMSFLDRGELEKAVDLLSRCIKFCRIARELGARLVESQTCESRARKWLARCNATMDQGSLVGTSRFMLREWRDSTGTFSIRARFVGADDCIRLETTEGNRKSIPIEKLSKQDKRWLAGNCLNMRKIEADNQENSDHERTD